jgi:N-acetylmuramoyl-L-alanine amidase
VTKTHIMVHHSLTADGDTVSWAAIEKYHKETHGWRDIGYHAGVECVTGNPDLAAYRFQALFGRGPDEQAAACPESLMNVKALHVCVVGNYDLEPPPEQALYVLVHRILLPWMRQFSIPPDNVIRHRDINPAKSCPGTRFDMDALRRMVR